MPRKSTTKPKLKDRLSMWEWDLLVGAWRNYEHGATITSASFPLDIVTHYWGEGNNYSDGVRFTIANQFSFIDHGSKGERDWVGTSFHTWSCDVRAWCAFYQFCRAWVRGFTPITVRDPKTTKETSIMAFHTDWDDRWLGRDEYIKHGENHYINPKFIIHIPTDSKDKR